MSGLVPGTHASARHRQSSQARRTRTPSPRTGAGGSGEGLPSASMSASSGLSRPQARSAARTPAMVPFVTPTPFWQQAACTPPRTRPNPGAEFAGERDEPAPGVGELHVAQRGEARVEQPLVAFGRAAALRFGHPHPGPVADLLADEQTPVRGIAHRGADEAVGGGHPPVLRHAPGHLLGVGEGAAQARVRQHRQDPPLERPEAGRESVHGENALRRSDRPLGCRRPACRSRTPRTAPGCARRDRRSPGRESASPRTSATGFISAPPGV